MMSTFSQSIKTTQLEAVNLVCLSCLNLSRKTFAELMVKQNHLFRYSSYVIVYNIGQPVKTQ